MLGIAESVRLEVSGQIGKLTNLQNIPSETSIQKTCHLSEKD